MAWKAEPKALTSCFSKKILSLSTHLNKASSGVLTMPTYQLRGKDSEDGASNRMSSSATTPSTSMALFLALLVALNITPVGAQEAQEETMPEINKANPADAQGEPGKVQHSTNRRNRNRIRWRLEREILCLKQQTDLFIEDRGR